MSSIRFARKTDTRGYNKRFVLAVEGRATERQYFKMINDMFTKTTGKVAKPIPHYKAHKTSALQILKQMQRYIRKNPLKDGDQAWLVLDKDDNKDADLDTLYHWTQEGKNGQRGLALSNPCFEYWLLLHFDAGNAASTKDDCNKCLKKYLPNYDKHISVYKFTRDRIKKAIEHAQKRDQPPCPDWPRQPGTTTVYRLVEALLEPDNAC